MLMYKNYKGINYCKNVGLQKNKGFCKYIEECFCTQANKVWKHYNSKKAMLKALILASFLTYLTCKDVEQLGSSWNKKGCSPKTFFSHS